MRSILKRYMPFLASGLVFGYSIPFSPAAFLYGVLLITFILVVYVKAEYNIEIYNKAIVLFVGVVVGAFFGKPDFCIEETFFHWSDICKLIWITMLACFGTMLFDAYAKTYLYRLKDNNTKPQIKWKEKNLFPEREYDLERLKKLIFDKKVSSIGLESKWGQGKSFLLEGLLEIISDKDYDDEVEIDCVVIDVLAVRLDKFPEYIVGELANILYQNGRISGNLKNLKSLFRKAKMDFLSNVLGDTTESYNKIFNDFRDELLKLGRLVLIIYEDIDRLEDKKAIRDIIYLTEKLTSYNYRVKRGGIKVIYQYDRQHMEQIGFSAGFLEKYIRRHMDLSVLDLRVMINKIQDDMKSTSQWENMPENGWINRDDVAKILFIRSNISYWFPEEKNWIDKYFSQGLTLRRTIDFVNSVLDKLRDEQLNTKERRNSILAFYFIQYFMPHAYQCIKEAQMPECPLWQVFCIPQYDGKKIYLMELAREIETRRQDYINSRTNWMNCSYKYVDDDFLKSIDYREQPKSFELFVAYKLLFSDDNMLYDKDVVRNMKEIDDYYSASSYDVYKRESLGYLNTERMIRYLLQAGYVYANHYVYWANTIAQQVLSCEDKALWEEKFLCILNRMWEDERGAGTIQFWGTLRWAEIFRSFVFAGKSWSKLENKNNFVNLIDLYDICRKHNKNTEDIERFSKKFINETLPLWEGVQGGDSLCKLVELVTRQKIYCNWNQYVNFYCYVKVALQALYVNTYLAGHELWMLEEVEKEAREGNWEFCLELTEEILDIVKNQLTKSHVILLRNKNKGYLPGEAVKLRVLIDLIEYFQNVMLHQEISKEKIGPSVHTEVYSPMAESYEKADAIEDDEVFKTYINNSEHGIGIANSINLIDKHEKRRDNNT